MQIVGRTRACRLRQRSRAPRYEFEPCYAHLLPQLTASADEQMVKLHLEEVSAKVRVGPPSDDDADLATDFWSGVIPVTTQYGVPEADPTLKPDISAPPNVAAYRRPTPSGQ